MTMVLFAQFAPVLILGPIAGVWVDRLRLKFVMKYSSIISSVLSFLTVPALLANHIPAVLILVGLSAVIQQFFQPATNKLLVGLLPKEHLLAANSLSRTTKTLMDLCGPIIGAAAYQLIGAEWTMILDGVSYLLAALCIVFIQYHDKLEKTTLITQKEKIKAFWKEFLDGVHYGWKNSTVRAIFIIFCMMSVAAGAVNLLNLFLVTEEIGLSENFAAWGNSVQGLGMLITALTLGAISKKIKAYRWLSVGGLAILMVGIFSLALAPNFWLLFISRFIIGIGITLLTIAVTTLFQFAVPEKLLGRIGAVLESAPTLVMLVSISVSGFLQTLISTRYIFIGAGAVLLLTCLIVILQLGCIVLQRSKPFVQILKTDESIDISS